MYQPKNVAVGQTLRSDKHCGRKNVEAGQTSISEKRQGRTSVVVGQMLQ
jgi:hypothetical protein